MKVLLLVGRSTGGIGHHVDRLATDLRGLGLGVTIVTDRMTADHFGWSGAEPLWPLRPGPAALRAPLDWHRVMLRARTVDVVHAHGHQAAVVAAVVAARARPRPRLVVSLHNDLPPGARSGPGARLVGWALRRADLVTGASDDLVGLARSLGARQPRLATVASPAIGQLLAAPVASDLERAAARTRVLDGIPGTDASRPLVLTVSRIAPQKDLDTLVAAARESASGATWVVVGAGDETLRAELERSASGIRLHFAGPVADIAEWLRAATVVVLTSRWEARSLVVQEAMAAGVPVVVPAVGGLPGLVADAGVVVPVGSAGAVAAAVDRLLGDPDERARRSVRGREVAAAWDTSEDEARLWVSRYRAALRP
ncbi:MAG TPA: glycosyltransferase family 4 protein [Intrasporangium sp.]|uniref:glycosyltransferase family 4 protein n=1 Tax=Intrasporangium sp. TaxID=1925024 RepID=UPI002D79C018|nr:glycosyltransferase family 4 protein [Intrasporangium sp.]HET7396915.1 glycosyltransferase family 4 protein [Intrasporangium sp.]